MKRFLSSNISWIYQYFDRNKGLLETFSFLMVAQTFMYSGELRDINEQSISAFKIVLWLMIFLIILLLQISTAVEIRRDGRNGEVTGHLLSGANFMKVVMRLLTLVLLIAAVPIFVKQIQTSLHNSLFSVFYISLAVIAVFEVLAYILTKVLPAKSR